MVLCGKVVGWLELDVFAGVYAYDYVFSSSILGSSPFFSSSITLGEVIAGADAVVAAGPPSKSRLTVS